MRPADFFYRGRPYRVRRENGGYVLTLDLPFTSKEEVSLLRNGDELVSAVVFVTTMSPTHTPAEIARAAWDLDALHERYSRFLAVHGKARPSAPAAVFAAWIKMFTSWRHFPLVDPELPDSLLPARWPRSRARALFTSRNEEWTGPALEYFRSL